MHFNKRNFLSDGLFILMHFRAVCTRLWLCFLHFPNPSPQSQTLHVFLPKALLPDMPQHYTLVPKCQFTIRTFLRVLALLNEEHVTHSFFNDCQRFHCTQHIYIVYCVRVINVSSYISQLKRMRWAIPLAEYIAHKWSLIVGINRVQFVYRFTHKTHYYIAIQMSTRIMICRWVSDDIVQFLRFSFRKVCTIGFLYLRIGRFVISTHCNLHVRFPMVQLMIDQFFGFMKKFVAIEASVWTFESSESCHCGQEHKLCGGLV